MTEVKQLSAMEAFSILSNPENGSFPFQYPGFCPACKRETLFTVGGSNLRGQLSCVYCGSLPRHRAIILAIDTFFPEWQDLRIHECSPGWDIVSRRLKKECKNYTATQYDIMHPLGSTVRSSLPCEEYICQNIETQTFADEAFDLFVCQDVFEHIFNPRNAITEIFRTLDKRNGGLIMTVPLVRRHFSSRRRSMQRDGEIVHIVTPPEYHGNPVSSEGSLVTIDWGYDICPYIQSISQSPTILWTQRNPYYGIYGELLDVIISRQQNRHKSEKEVLVLNE